jgi:hypothetical protein
MEYRLYLIGASGKIQAAHDIDVNDEAGALTIARHLFGENEFEVWRSKLRVFPPIVQDEARAQIGQSAGELRY